ncbi:MAG: 1-acyl-sn-glycerol-3-phosphate acyltransferase [Anaerolineae bacterium]|nr:1-acyl-sn-glycerol-3-phosphate acyltransferase [Anaerolineae bacterium]
MFPLRVRIIRAIVRAATWFVLRVLTRSTITGMEHTRIAGPVIYAGNHTSTFDAMLLFILPHDTEFVGPADFKLLWPGNIMIHHAGLILAKRGSVDRAGLKLMTEVLKGGGRLGMFPDGGTWEKPIDDVKSGATYLSNATGAKIVPIAIGGAYQIWRKIALLRFPRVTITFGEPIPPVEVSGDRKTRQDELQAAAVAVMHTIYDLLPPETQAHYDRFAREQYSGKIVFHRRDAEDREKSKVKAGESQKPEVDVDNFENSLNPMPDSSSPYLERGAGGEVSTSGVAALNEISFGALAELVVKPNLFSPLHRNAHLPVKPFLPRRGQYGRYVAPAQMQRACDAMLAAFAEGDYANFLEYRLGDAKAAAIRASLAAISAAMQDMICKGDAQNVRVAFVPTVTERAN